MSASDYFGCGGSSTLSTKVYDDNELRHFRSLSLYLGAFADGRAWSGADFFQVQNTTSHNWCGPPAKTSTSSTTITSPSSDSPEFNQPTIPVSVMKLSYSCVISYRWGHEPTSSFFFVARNLGLWTRGPYLGLANILFGFK